MPVTLVNGLEIQESSGLYFKEQVRRSSSSGLAGSACIRAGFASTPRSIPRCSAPPKRSSRRAWPTSSIVPGYKHPRRGSDAPIKEGSLPQYLQGALVAMDPTTGYVRAMVGGRDFDESRFNRAIQAKRQSGSAFKPFVYATALEAGYSPATVIENLNDPIPTPQGGWVPEDEHSTADSMTLRTALRTSSNRAAVQLLERRRHQERGGLRRAPERRDAAERAVAGARRERRDADVADRGVWRVRGWRHRATARPHPARRGS